MRERALADVEKLQKLLDSGSIESGPVRLGAEQEMFLVDPEGRPAHVAEQVLAQLSDDRFTPEVGKFNLEANVRPRTLDGTCLRDLEVELYALLGLARKAAATAGADVVLAGILPSLSPRDLDLRAMMPRPRYHALDEATRHAHDGEIRVRIDGLDSLWITHGNMMLEACATSFQVHLQVSPDDFARRYNVAQLVAAPLVAVSANAPIFLGRRLWDETRIALLEQAADFRSDAQVARGEPGRLGLGLDWLEGSIADLFREDIARWEPILMSDSLDSPGDPLPRLPAMQLHNGTIWRWNRPCYGVGDGGAHLRIECRVIPAGPTVADEVANAALWLGVMLAGPDAWGDVSKRLSFEEARENLHRAAREGLDARLGWLGGRTRTARDLLVSELVPLARAGLLEAGVDPSDVERSLETIRERALSGRTGAAVTRDAFERMRDPEAVVKLLREQLELGRPVHTWGAEAGTEHARISEGHAHPGR